MLGSDFRKAVDKTSTRITRTEVDSQKKAIVSENLDGFYDVQYERDDTHSDATMHLTFTHGYCGWHIRCTRNGHDDGPFVIGNGFLAPPGKIYWEERRELGPAYHDMLVIGQLEADTFHGEWLTSKDMQRGKSQFSSSVATMRTT